MSHNKSDGSGMYRRYAEFTNGGTAMEVGMYRSEVGAAARSHGVIVLLHRPVSSGCSASQKREESQEGTFRIHVMTP